MKKLIISAFLLTLIFLTIPQKSDALVRQSDLNSGAFHAYSAKAKYLLDICQYADTKFEKRLCLLELQNLVDSEFFSHLKKADRETIQKMVKNFDTDTKKKS